MKMFEWLKNVFNRKNSEPVEEYNPLWKYELIEEAKRTAELNFLSPAQIEEVVANNEDLDFLDSEMAKKMNEIDREYIIRKLLPPIRHNEKKTIDPKEIVIGSIIGDIIGSKYEFTYHDYAAAKTESLPKARSFFTDDTVLSIATMNAVLENSVEPDYRLHYLEGYKKYPRVGYGSSFVDWALNDNDNTQGYHSMANGAAMRLSFIPAYYDKIEDVMRQTIESVEVTHNHTEAVKHSLILSVCIWMAIHNYSKEEIELYCDRYFHYTEEEREKLYYGGTQFKWSEPLYELSNKMSRETLFINSAVPFAIKCFLETNSYEECMREILSHYGDTDTICAIAGGLCVAYYGTTGLDNEKILREASVPQI